MVTRIVHTLLMLGVLYTPYYFARCDIPTYYKNCYYYTVYLTKPEKAPDNFYLVLTSNQHSLYGGQRHKRMATEPLIHFEQYKQTQKKSASNLAFVQYQDFMDAINSDQPAHNVRVRAGDHYITLSKIFVREFRNGIAGKTLNKIIHTKHS